MIEADVYAALAAAGKPTNARDLGNSMGLPYGPVATALYRLRKKGAVVALGPTKIALWVAMPDRQPVDQRGTNPLSQRNLETGRLIKLAKFDAVKRTPSAPVHTSPLAQALAWCP